MKITISLFVDNEKQSDWTISFFNEISIFYHRNADIYKMERRQKKDKRLLKTFRVEEIDRKITRNHND